MKSLIFNLTILLFIILNPLASVEDKNYNLTVDIVNIAMIKGELCFAVYNDEASFKQKKKSATMVIPVKGSSERVSFRLPAGEYSVVVVQDINGNRKMDYFLSLPIEPYGASNNHRGYPSFRQSKFKLDENKSITIKINN